MAIVLAEYGDLERYESDRLHGRVPRPRCCERCGHGRVWFDGSYPRYANVLLACGTRLRQQIRIVRCRCASCLAAFGLLPGFLRAGCQFGFETILLALAWFAGSLRRSWSVVRGENGLGPSERSVRRWHGWCIGEADLPPCIASPSHPQSAASLALRDCVPVCLPPPE